MKVLEQIRSKFTLLLVFLNLLLLAGIFMLLISFTFINNSQGVNYGVSFSQKYAQELDLEWKQAYTATLTDLNIKNLRLMSYWDIHEEENEKFNFADLDWMMDKAHENDAKVNLVIGLRQPRWPECHMPEWVKHLDENSRNKELTRYITAVVNRYKSHPALLAWQLENEPSNNLFGECPSWNKAFFDHEFQIVKDIDHKNAIATTASNQTGIPLKQPVGDKVGFSVYRHAYPVIFGKSIKWSYWYMPFFWHSFRAGLIDRIHDVPIYIHELQAEPWGPEATPDLTISKQNELMNPVKLHQHVEYALKTGIDDVHLWGVEWWYWRKAKFNDPAMWNTAKEIFNQE